MDRARFGRRRQNRRPAQVEGQDLVADAVHPRHAASGERARGGRFRQLGSRRRRRASLSMARAPSRAKAPRNSSSAIGAASAAARCLAAALGAGGARAAGGSGERPLAEGDAADAAPAEMGVDPLDDHCRGVLRFEREGRVDAQHQRRRRDRVRVLLARRAAAIGFAPAGRSARRRRRRSRASRRSGSSGQARARRASARRCRQAATRPAPVARAACRSPVSPSRRRR